MTRSIRSLLLTALALVGLARTATADCSLRVTGNVPLTDLASDLYLGRYQGGLYPEGSSSVPRRHLRLALNAGRSIEPLDRFGNSDPQGGKIVLASIGMSNSKLEFDSFLEQANADARKNPKLQLFNAAQGGAPAADWVDPFSAAWDNAERYLERAGLSAAQVQVVWVKQAENFPADLGPFPTHVEIHQAHLEHIARAAQVRFPNLKLAFFSSRTRAYTDDPTALSPEPFAYESSFAVKWLIEKQIDGDPGLNANPALGEVVAPILLWGPYLWADGVASRSDGFTWACSDTRRDDFIHPSTPGQQKVGELLLEFFKSHPAAEPWFVSGLTPPRARD